MNPDIDHILFDEKALESKINQLAAAISTDYNELVAIVVLKGAMFFATDLLKLMTIPVQIDTMHLGSYGMNGAKSAAVRLNNDIKTNIDGKDVLLIEDIIDSGQTMHFILDLFKLRNPRSLKICSLLTKPSRREVDIKIDYLGFEIPDKFVVGYGFDYKENYRTLPYIGVLKEELYR